jgi:hypothetical protein
MELNQVICAILNFFATKLTFNQGISSITKMQHNIRHGKQRR